MPKPTDFHGKGLKQTTFMKIQEEIATRSDANAPILLHVGDTWFDLPEELNQPLAHEPWNNRMSRYGDTMGEPELRRRLAKKVREKNGLPVQSEDEIQLASGAAGALYILMRRVMDPGSEVLTLSPYWTIFRTVASTAGVKAVEVPFFDRLAEADEDVDLAEWLEPYVTEKTSAIYFNNPNNPSGVLFKRKQLEAIADFAKRKNLWVISDEAYEDFVWSDGEYISIGSLPDMYERTISVFTFSKSLAAAGIRLGYVAAPIGAIAAMNTAHVGICYEPNRIAQVQAIRGLEHFDQIIARIRESYLEALRVSLENVKVPFIHPEGSFYLFLDLRERWGGLSDKERMNRMIDAGVVLSPGAAFGKAYDGWARFCFTAEKPDVIAEAAERVNNL